MSIHETLPDCAMGDNIGCAAITIPAIERAIQRSEKENAR